LRRLLPASLRVEPRGIDERERRVDVFVVGVGGGRTGCPDQAALRILLRDEPVERARGRRPELLVPDALQRGGGERGDPRVELDVARSGARGVLAARVEGGGAPVAVLLLVAQQPVDAGADRLDRRVGGARRGRGRRLLRRRRRGARWPADSTSSLLCFGDGSTFRMCPPTGTCSRRRL
jgi:hypothetical protein